MTEQSRKDQVAPAAKKAKPESPTTTAVPPSAPAESQASKHPFSPILVVLALALATAALAAAGFVHWRLQKQAGAGVAMAERMLVLEQTADAARRDAEAGLSLARQGEAALGDLREEQQRLQGTVARLEGRALERQEDWVLAEVYYLVQLASHRLSLEQDPATAAAALRAADDRLRNLAGPEMVPLRERLIGDINALEAVPAVDVPGLALYLADLVARVETLPLRAALGGTAEPAAAVPEPEPGWRALLSEVWQELKALVVVRRDSALERALLDPEQQALLYQNLRLELQAARLSVLRRDGSGFRSSLDLSRDWLQRYFDSTAPAVANVLDALERMTGIELQPPLPSLDATLAAVRERLGAAGGAGD